MGHCRARRSHSRKLSTTPEVAPSSTLHGRLPRPARRQYLASRATLVLQTQSFSQVYTISGNLAPQDTPPLLGSVLAEHRMILTPSPSPKAGAGGRGHNQPPTTYPHLA